MCNTIQRELDSVGLFPQCTTAVMDFKLSASKTLFEHTIGIHRLPPDGLKQIFNRMPYVLSKIDLFSAFTSNVMHLLQSTGELRNKPLEWDPFSSPGGGEACFEQHSIGVGRR